MFPSNEVFISRRGAIRLITAGTVAILILTPSTSHGATSATRIEKHPRDIDAYINATKTQGVTDLNGIHAEYREAVEKFPLPLPIGWSFPAESSLRDSTPDSLWERGNGVAEVYLYWQSAVASAALAAHLAGDTAGANDLLDMLESGYNTPVRRTVLEDPSERVIALDVTAARTGNFDPIRRIIAG